MKNFKENIMRVCKKMKKIISLAMLTIFVFSSAVYSYESALRVPIASKKRLVDLIGLTTEAKLVMEGNAVSVGVGEKSGKPVYVLDFNRAGKELEQLLAQKDEIILLIDSPDDRDILTVSEAIDRLVKEKGNKNTRIKGLIIRTKDVRGLYSRGSINDKLSIPVVALETSADISGLIHAETVTIRNGRSIEARYKLHKLVPSVGVLDARLALMKILDRMKTEKDLEGLKNLETALRYNEMAYSSSMDLGAPSDEDFQSYSRTLELLKEVRSAITDNGTLLNLIPISDLKKVQDIAMRRGVLVTNKGIYEPILPNGSSYRNTGLIAKLNSKLTILKEEEIRKIDQGTKAEEVERVLLELAREGVESQDTKISRGADKGVIGKGEHEVIRQWLQDHNARSEDNRRRDLERAFVTDGKLLPLDVFGADKEAPENVKEAGMSAEIYAVPDMYKTLGIKGHWATRDGIIYVDKDALDKRYGILYLDHEIDELIGIRLFAIGNRWSFQKLVDWLDYAGSPDDVRRELINLHNTATRLPDESEEIVLDYNIMGDNRPVRGAAGLSVARSSTLNVVVINNAGNILEEATIDPANGFSKTDADRNLAIRILPRWEAGRYSFSADIIVATIFGTNLVDFNGVEVSAVDVKSGKEVAVRQLNHLGFAQFTGLKDGKYKFKIIMARDGAGSKLSHRSAIEIIKFTPAAIGL